MSVPAGATLAVLGRATAPARRRCCACSPGCCARTAAAARVLGAELPGERWKLPGRVGYLGHEPLLYRELSGRENLGYHARLHGVAPERVDELLARRAAMEQRAPTTPCATSRGAWSSGWPRRARVLHDPPLLLLDEPRANLDPGAAELLEPLIGRASGRTRVLVSHDVEGALAEADLALGLQAAAGVRRRGAGAGAGALPVIGAARGDPRARTCRSSCARRSRCRR